MGDDEDLGIAFIFGSDLPRKTSKFMFANVEVNVSIADDGDPGALQSGSYLWPAAVALAAYVVRCWDDLPHGDILELGAGVGLVGLAAAQLQNRNNATLVTDHDPGVVARLREAGAEQSARVAKAAAVSAALLSWGPVDTAARANLLDAMAAAGVATTPVSRSGNGQGSSAGDAGCDSGGHGSSAGGNGNRGIDDSGTPSSGGTSDKEAPRFPLILGSDLLYDLSVVDLLFTTVDALLAWPVSETAQAPLPTFLMCQSFAYDSALETKIDGCCSRFGLRRTVVVDTLSSGGGGRGCDGSSGGYKLQQFYRARLGEGDNRGVS
ncbi:unnamed protein product [Phaeothamnion confervicola]